VTDGSSVTFWAECDTAREYKRVTGFMNKHKEIQPQLH